MSIYLIPVLGVIGSFILTIVIVIAMAQTSRRKAELRMEVQTKLIDKFGTAPELVAFLESPSGQQFVDRVQGAPAAISKERVVSGMRKGVILAALGLGFLVIWLADHNDGFIYPGAILLALGVGQLLAAYISMQLSSRLGLDDRSTTDNL